MIPTADYTRAKPETVGRVGKIHADLGPATYGQSISLRDRSSSPTTNDGEPTAAVFLGVTIALAIALLALFRALFHLAGSGFFDRFPLFPFTFPAAVLVQLCARRYDFEWAVNRRAVEGLGGMAIDGVIICAVGTLSLGAIGANVGPLLILAAASIAWSVFLALVIGRRVFPQHWFEHSIAEFGESQGMLACGFVMVDMVDPSRQTDVVRGYSYRQIITRPILGGGFMTALAVPLIDRFGPPAFTIATALVAGCSSPGE